MYRFSCLYKKMFSFVFTFSLSELGSTQVYTLHLVGISLKSLYYNDDPSMLHFYAICLMDKPFYFFFRISHALCLADYIHWCCLTSSSIAHIYCN